MGQTCVQVCVYVCVMNYKTTINLANKNATHNVFSLISPGVWSPDFKSITLTYGATTQLFDMQESLFPLYIHI